MKRHPVDSILELEVLGVGQLGQSYTKSVIETFLNQTRKVKSDDFMSRIYARRRSLGSLLNPESLRQLCQVRSDKMVALFLCSSKTLKRQFMRYLCLLSNLPCFSINTDFGRSKGHSQFEGLQCEEDLCHRQQVSTPC